MPNVLKERMNENTWCFWNNVLKESNVLKEKGMMSYVWKWICVDTNEWNG